MANIAASPFVLKNVTLKIAADNYEASVSAVEFVPSTSAVTWRGLTPTASFTSTGVATWTANLSYAQDWANPTSLSRYLFNNEGNSVAVELYPASGGNGFSATLVIMPGSIGGAVDTVATATVTLGVQGRPAEIAVTSGLPVISASDPATGPIAGGTLIEVNGINFDLVTAVKFGTVNATSFKIVSSGVIVAVAPAQAVGIKSITLVNAVGTSLASPYTYV